MDTLPADSKTISGDLPIRETKPIVMNLPPEPQPESSTGTRKSETSPETLPEPRPKTQPGTTRFEDEVASSVGRAMTAVQKKKKRRTRRPKSQRGKDKPSGFEEYNADGPLTRGEYDEDRRIYDPSRTFLDRLDTVLVRYQFKRRLESERRNIFHKFLQYGGVTVGPNFGTGATPKELQEMGDEQAMRVRSQTEISKEHEGIEISFTKVARAFLGSFMVRFFNPDSEESINFTTETLHNFYTYLLFHEVFPEYEDDILEARRTCNQAEVELCKGLQLVRKGPGSFNEACSTLFGGSFFVEKLPEGWGEGDDDKMSLEDARNIVKFAIAGASPHEHAVRFQELANKDAFTTEKVEDIHGFEIITVTSPDDAIREFYHEFAPTLIPVGKIRARAFRDPAKTESYVSPEAYMSPEESREWDKRQEPKYEFDFLLEENLLEPCYPGLKVMTNVWRLNCGVHYFDHILSTYPTFYTVLANDLMLEWKKPKVHTGDDGKGPDHVLDDRVREVVDVAVALKIAQLREQDKKAREGMDDSDVSD